MSRRYLVRVIYTAADDRMSAEHWVQEDRNPLCALQASLNLLAQARGCPPVRHEPPEHERIIVEVSPAAAATTVRDLLLPEADPDQEAPA